MASALRYNDLRTDRGALQYEYRGMIKSFGETVVCCGKGLNAEEFCERMDQTAQEIESGE